MQAHSHSVHRQILKDAFYLAWQNKWLWVLGFFAAFWGSHGAAQFFTSAIQTDGSGKGGLSFWQRVQELQNFSFAPSPANLITLIVLVIIAVAIIWLTTASRGGLISCAYKISGKKKSQIRTALTEGTTKFWQIFFLSLLGKILGGIFLLGLIWLVLYFSSSYLSANLLVYFLGFAAFLALVIITSFVIVFALAFAIIENFKFFQAIGAALHLFFKNWLLVLELALLLYLIGFILSLAIVIFGLILAVPLILLLAIVSFLKISFGFWLVFTPFAVFFLAVLLLLGAGFNTFQVSAWVLLFKRLTKEGAVAKLIRVFHGHKK